jgi:RNA polymerase sigma factor (sigma-70 family)
MEPDLVVRAQHGDHAAFTALVAGSAKRLYEVARLILRREDLAEEAVQEAFVKAWTSIRGLRDPARFDAWTYRLVVHACYRASRREANRRHVEVGEISIEGPRTADTQQSVAQRDELERGFRRLSTDQRAALIAHYYLDLSDHEAAAVLAIPPGTFKSRLNRATNAMRAALEADERLSGSPLESPA